MSWICRDYFFSLLFPLAAKLIGPQTGCHSLKRPIVLATLPLRVNPLESRRVAYDSEDGYEFPYPGFEGLKSHKNDPLIRFSVILTFVMLSNSS